jgi:hypothetical protein
MQLCAGCHRGWAGPQASRPVPYRFLKMILMTILTSITKATIINARKPGPSDILLPPFDEPARLTLAGLLILIPNYYCPEFSERTA